MFLRQKLLYASNIIVVCEFNRGFLREHYPDIFDSIADKIHLHHLGLDLAEFRYEPGGRQVQRVLGVGGLEKYKGFEYLLRATRELAYRGIDIDIELIGDGQEKDTLEALARQLRINDRLKLRGWLPIDEVRRIMEQATILVHPSMGLGDAVPTVIKEAMALGTPVIASEIAGVPELLNGGRCGVLVPPKDVKALADGIEALLGSIALRRTYAEAARKYAEDKFDLRRNGRLLANVLASTKGPTEAVSL
ncbi:hypothetical protein YTPLAS18_18530 [Nitrospira sp.]|nr:hypothetical protein YTPLAS18_18530 [Nitrospira sp.]